MPSNYPLPGKLRRLSLTVFLSLRWLVPYLSPYAFSFIGPILPIVRFRRTSVAINCAASDPSPILITSWRSVIKLRPAFWRDATGNFSSVSLVILLLAMPSKASPATLWTSGILKVFLRLIVRPRFGEEVRRRGDRTALLVGLRRRVDVLRLRALARRQAFLLMPPACLMAHLGSLAT